MNLIKKYRQSGAILLALALIFSFGFGQAPKPAAAADDSLTIHSANLYLYQDPDGNGIVNVGDTIALEVIVSNTDGGCTAAGTIVTADLLAYGLNNSESLSCFTDNGGTADVFFETFTVVDSYSDGIDVGVSDNASKVTVTASDSDESGANPTMETNAMANPVDTLAPYITAAAMWVLDTSTGYDNTFKVGDLVIFQYDADLDAIADLAAVYADFRDFSETPGTDRVLMTDTGCGGDADDGILEACIYLEEGTIDKTDASAWMWAVDDADNEYEQVDNQDHKVDIAFPALAEVAVPITFKKQNADLPSSRTRFWYFYEDGTPDALFLSVSAKQEADFVGLPVIRLCTKSLIEEDQSENSFCTLEEFQAVPGPYINFNVYSGGGIYHANAQNEIPNWPSEPGGYPMNLYMVDNAGNVTIVYDEDIVPVGVFGINPIDSDPGLDNAQTTDWSDILDFTAVTDLVFSYEEGVLEIGRLTFSGPLNLCDQDTINGLGALSDNLDIGAGEIRLDSSALLALNADATLMMQMSEALQPGLAVYDNDGLLEGYVPNDQSGSLAVGGKILDGFTFNGFNQLIFTTTGFSQFVADNTAPTVVSTSPSDGASSVVYSSNITINFSEPMNTGSLSVTDSDIGTGSYVYTWSNNDQTLKITHDNWTLGAAVTLTIDAEDKVGNVLSTKTVNFTVRSTAGGGGGGGSFTPMASTTPTITLSKPLGGETWTVGETRSLTWSLGGSGISTVALEYSADNGASWQTLAENLSASVRAYSWIVPAPALKARIRATGFDSGKGVLDQDVSGAFAISGLSQEEQEQMREEADEEMGITRDAEGKRLAPLSGEQGISPFDGQPEEISLVEPGWFVRGANYDTIYLITQDGQRRPFWNATTFFTWADSWNEVIWVTDATLATLPMGAPMLPRPGAVLIKIQSDPCVYFVEETGRGYELRWIISEDVAEAMLGRDWADYVIDVDATMFAHYQVGENLSVGAVVDWSIVKKREYIANR